MVAELASQDHIRALPKVELHVHVEGAARPTTLASLAKNNEVQLPVADPSDLYVYEGLEDFIAVYELVCRCLVRSEDFERDL